MAEPVQLARTKAVRRALRLVGTRTLDRAEWLDYRKRGIGGSDAAAAVGLSPYKSPLELWMEKTGRDQDLPRPDPNDTRHPVYWGNLLEPIVAAAYTRQTGRRVRRVNAILQHPTHPFMLANLDREVINEPDVAILECKTAGEHGARRWKDGVPDEVQLQVQHQLAVTGHAAADVAVLICGQTLEVHRLQRDEALIDRLITLEERFWRHVTTDVAPAADGSEFSGRSLGALFPRGARTALDWSDDSRMSGIFSDLVAVRRTLAEHEATAEQLTQQIQQAMGDADEALFESGRVTYRRSRDSSTVDLERLKTEHPELIQQYVITRAGSRRFRVCD